MSESLLWWPQGVVYEVYPRSFADGNGDGTGDIAGIRSRLGYLRELGVDAIWITPWYPSPMHDGGYDVADYRDIDPRFGTLDESVQLIREAHDHDLKVIIDLVPNHTSDQHVWFQEAIAAPPGHPARARYHIHPGKGVDGAEPPSDWKSVFGGTAWHRLADGEWYLHIFDESQPDLNWDNEEVRKEFRDVFQFWLDRGVDGFRVDVAHGLVKDPAFPDMAEDSELLESARRLDHPFWDRDGVHEIIREWREVLDASDRDVMMVAEAWVHSTRLPLYLRHDEYHQSFNFDFLECEWNPTLMRASIDGALGAAASVHSTPTWAFSNHDVVRHATRYGLPPNTNWRRWLLNGPHDALDADCGLRRARAAALLLLGLPGSAYMYQGEELGLPEVWDLPLEVLDDPVWERSNHVLKGRDGCRVPLPWTAEGPSLGFGDAEPWLPQPEWFADLAAAAQDGVAGSTLELYRRALRIRSTDLVHAGGLTWLDLGVEVLAFRRGDIACFMNFGADALDLPPGEVLVHSASSAPKSKLLTDEAAWVRLTG